jgi:hypothetical protein
MPITEKSFDFNIGQYHLYDVLCISSQPTYDEWSYYDLRNKSWKPECVGSFNMDWRY